jgi:hypothetical protein
MRPGIRYSDMMSIGASLADFLCIRWRGGQVKDIVSSGVATLSAVSARLSLEGAS